MNDSPTHRYLIYSDAPQVTLDVIEEVLDGFDPGPDWSSQPTGEPENGAFALTSRTSLSTVSVVPGMIGFGAESFPGLVLSGDGGPAVEDASLLLAKRLQEGCQVDEIGVSILRLVGDMWLPHGSGLLAKGASRFDIELPWERPKGSKRHWFRWAVVVGIAAFIAWRLLSSDDSASSGTTPGTGSSEVINLSTASLPKCSLFQEGEVVPLAFRLNEGDLGEAGLGCVNGNQRHYSEIIECEDSDERIFAHSVGYAFEHGLIFHFGPPPEC
jgi:hypothetical protein